MAGGLLAVHAHPDDETLSTGALLATWAAAGLPVTVVTCTRGERGEVIGPERARLEGNGPALAAFRTGELTRALGALGVADHVFLDGAAADDVAHRWLDSGMAWLDQGLAGGVPDVDPRAFVQVDVDVAARRLADVLHDRRPAVVVGYEPGGGYGHPDHVHAHRVLMRALELDAERPDDDGAAPPVVLWAAVDATRLHATYRACPDLLAGAAAPAAGRGGTLRCPDPGGPLPSAAVAPARIGVRVPVPPVLPALLGALAAHATQVQAVRELPVAREGVVATFALSDDVLQGVSADECYRVVAGDPRGVGWPAGVRVA